MPLFWRVTLSNAAVLVAAVVALALTPATVSAPLASSEALVLAAWAVSVIVVNLALLRPAFRPLERLAETMDRVDLMRPGTRLDQRGAGETARFIAAFNRMLARLEDERRLSGRRALSAQEAERRRIAQELHDEVGQVMTAVVLGLTRAEGAAPAPLRPELRRLRETARSGLEEVGRIAERLRPGVLEDLGLPAAVTALCRGVSAATGLRVDCRIDSGLPALDDDAELGVYRVAQEALTNAARHSGGTGARVELSHAGHGRVRLRVADDGRGVAGASPSAGMTGMRERAMFLGGELLVDDGADGGASVVLEIPGATGVPGAS